MSFLLVLVIIIILQKSNLGLPAGSLSYLLGQLPKHRQDIQQQTGSVERLDHVPGGRKEAEEGDRWQELWDIQRKKGGKDGGKGG